MSQDTSNQLPVPESLETPERPPAPKGLVKRKGFLWVAGGLLAFLLVMFLRDVLSSEDAATPSAKGPVGTPSNPASAANFAKPQVNELDAMAAAADAAASRPSAAVQPNLPPTLGPVTAHPGSPLPAGRPAGAAGTVGMPGPVAGRSADPDVADAESAGAANASNMTFVDEDRDGGAQGQGQGQARQAAGQQSNPAADLEASLARVDEAAKRERAEADRKQEAMLQTLMSGARQGAGMPAAGHRTSSDREWLNGFSKAATPSASVQSGQIDVAQVQMPKQLPERMPILLQGTRIPLVSIGAINSDMPGTLSARVSADVYDSFTQTRVVIPRGTRADLSYSSEIRPGQTRVLIASSRLVRPDGLVVDMAGAQGTDTLGRSGLEGNVNNHFLKMFGYSLATALISVKVPNEGLTSSTSGNGQTSTSTVAGQVLGDISQRILSRNQDIPPTITLPIGTKFNLVVNRDVGLPVFQIGR